MRYYGSWLDYKIIQLYMTVTACMEAWFIGFPVQHHLRGVALNINNGNIFKLCLTRVRLSIIELFGIQSITRDNMINFLLSALPKCI